MLTQTTLLTALAFSVLYPLCFWISADDPLRHSFHKFHLGLPNVVGGVVLVVILLMDVPWSVKGLVIAWKATFLTVSRYFWKKGSPSPLWISLTSLIGVAALLAVQGTLLGWSIVGGITLILSGLIFCAVLFAMNLGHWYLNVQGLPLFHLRRASYVAWGLVACRFLWNVVRIASQTVLYNGDRLSLPRFLGTTDGFLLWVGIFFGVLFPLVGFLGVRGTLAAKNTQATTGILYVLLCSVVLGDLAYKYYWIRFGIFL